MDAAANNFQVYRLMGVKDNGNRIESKLNLKLKLGPLLRSTVGTRDSKLVITPIVKWVTPVVVVKIFIRKKNSYTFFSQ